MHNCCRSVRQCAKSPAPMRMRYLYAAGIACTQRRNSRARACCSDLLRTTGFGRTRDAASVSVGFRRTGAIQHATGQGTSSTCQRQCQPTPRTAGIESGPSTSALAGFLSSGDSPAFPSRRMLYSGRSTRRTNRGRETPWTAGNRDKEQQKVTIPPTRKPTAETESPSVQADSLRDRSGLVKNLHRMSQSRKGSCVTSAV